MSIPPKAFTVRHPGRVRQLVTDVRVAQAFQPGSPVPAQKPFRAIWDTGATGSVITQSVVDGCGLVSTGMAQVHHAQGMSITETYLVSILLHLGLGFHSVRVSKGILPTGADLLIGMDIITMGDFSITNKDGKTCFSFRIPSAGEVDYQKALTGNVDSNAPCPCGSGKKYRKCCQGRGAPKTT